jgi:hypothetical protein
VTPHRPAYASSTCETHRNAGPRGVHGCVTLEFERAPSFRFSSTVQWPSSDNYDSVVEHAVLEAIQKTRGEQSYACRLIAIKWHPVDSCAAGFAFAARQATHAALEKIA